MARLRITRLPLLLTALGLVAIVMAGLGTLVALWSQPASASRSSTVEPPCSPQHPCLALVIDDVGRDLDALEQLLALRLDLTFSVLPHARHTKQSLAAIRRRSREILVHLPMAPTDLTRITDETVVLGRDAPLERALDACLDRVPGAVGASNHMGSRLSAMPEAVSRVLRGIARRGLWFLDSRTTSHSLFCTRARSEGVPCVERDVFLDDPPRPETVTGRLAEAMQLARKQGKAVAIGHPLPATIALLRHLDRLEQPRRVRIRRLSRLVDGT
jgi:polysaccharide deacetylase 2 family uncharacterized protein YibQ